METQTAEIHIEMLPVTNGNDAQDSVDGAARRNGEETETLLTRDGGSANGSVVLRNGAVDTETETVPEKTKSSVLLQIQQELTEKVCRVVPLWLVLLLIFVVVVIIIFVSLSLCRAVYEDPDESFNPAQFDAVRNVSGSFLLLNINSTEEELLNTTSRSLAEELLNMTSSRSRSLAEELQSKLDEVYTNSPALGRYFMRSEIYKFSSFPVKAWFLLMFRMREEEGAQLSRFTLSREFLYNVLRQFLNEQEVGVSHHMFILPSSLNMSALSD